MTIRGRIQDLGWLAGSLVLLAGLAGCVSGRDSTAAPESPQQLQLDESSLRWVQVPRLPGMAHTENLADTTAKTFDVKAKDGGHFTHGRITLDIPPHALIGDAKITIQPNRMNIVGCNLSISPTNLNGFMQPVTLTMNLSGTGVAANNIDLVKIYWELGETPWWINIGGKPNKLTLSVSTELIHFSNYRAGW